MKKSIKEVLRTVYEIINRQVSFKSSEFSEKERYIYYIAPESNERNNKLGIKIAIVERILVTFPELTLDVERCEEGHRLIIYPKKEGTEFNFNYASERLDKIKNRGNGILLMIVNDRLVTDVWVSYADKPNEIVLTSRVLRAVMELGTQEKAWKKSGLGTSKCDFYEKGTCLGKRLNEKTDT